MLALLLPTILYGLATPPTLRPPGIDHLAAVGPPRATPGGAEEPQGPPVAATEGSPAVPGTGEPAADRTADPSARDAPDGATDESSPPSDDADPAEPPPKLVPKLITKALNRFLAGRPAPVTAMVKDLKTGRSYRYHHHERLITASTAKVQILMALLLKTPWRKLSKATRRDADLMIRYSDNHAADRLWLRIGGAPGFTKAGRKFGLRHTAGVAGDCIDLYCWGITRTSAEDQIRLMKALTSKKSPLAKADQQAVLRLMAKVIKSQHWGISAGACKGQPSALKNGWLKRVSTKRWAIVSVGVIAGRYAVAVLTEGSADMGVGIATVEGVTKRIMPSFRRCR